MIINPNLNLNKRILIVDDEPYNIIGMTTIMQQCGYPNIKSYIDKAYNGLQAVETVKKAYYDQTHTYGLIIMDCSMPFMDGYEATIKIRSFYRTKKILQPMVVACTGHNEPEYIQKAWRYEMDEVVPKPTDIEVIKSILKGILVD